MFKKLNMVDDRAFCRVSYRVVLWVVFAGCFLLKTAFVSEADESIPRKKAIECIMGEARGEEFSAIVATAEALRNRFEHYGDFRGVYGCRATFNEPKWVWERVERAFDRSAHTELVRGAYFWESVDFDEPYWAKNAQIIARYGKHVFYKGVK